MKSVQPFALATILAVGFGVFCALIGSWVSEQVRHATRRNDPVERLVLKADGTPAVMYSQQVLDPNMPLQPPRPDEEWLDTTVLAFDVHELWPFIRGDWRWRLRRFADSHFPGLVWFFVTDIQRHGTAYFAGYDERGKQCIGYLGTAGFRADSLPVEEYFPFQGNGRGSIFRLHSLNAVPWGQFKPIDVQPPKEADMPSHVFLQADNDRIYLVDLVKRTVDIAFSDRSICSSAILMRSHPAADAGRRDLVVRTDDTVIVINGRDGTQQRFTIPPELRDTSFSWGQTTTGEVLVTWNEPVPHRAEVYPYHIAWFDAAGAIARRTNGELHYPRSPNEARWLLGVTVPAPLLADVGVSILNPLLQFGGSEPYGRALTRELGEYWPSLLYVHILSAILAGLCYRRQLQNRASRADRVVWPLFVFLLGLPGWIGYRYTVAPSVVESPAPALRGTEVFA
jgi:hypothetical protein